MACYIISSNCLDLQQQCGQVAEVFDQESQEHSTIYGDKQTTMLQDKLTSSSAGTASRHELLNHSLPSQNGVGIPAAPKNQGHRLSDVQLLG